GMDGSPETRAGKDCPTWARGRRFSSLGRINGPFTRRPRRAAISPMLGTQMRPALAAAALTAALAALLHAPAPAQDARLPDIGSSAATVISPAEQAEYGAMMLSQLRYYGYTLEDPLLLSWLRA